jgi:phage terminase large subunit GpA-like protein
MNGDMFMLKVLCRLGGLFLTAGVDVQKDRLECEVVAWGRNKESWSVDYIVLDGDTARPDVWRRLDTEVLQRDWPHATGNTMPIRVMAVDSGYATQDVYGFVRNHPQAVWGGNGARASQPRTVVAVKGQDRDTALILSVGKAIRAGNVVACGSGTSLAPWPRWSCTAG